MPSAHRTGTGRRQATGSKDIDVVLLAGGSTRMPMVIELLKSYFGKEPSKALNPDECVALGAAVKAALLQQEVGGLLPGKGQVWALPGKMKDINVTSHSFGLAVIRDGELFNSIIIPKNTPYPVEESRTDFTTSYDRQETLDLHVLEGEGEDPRDCDLVGGLPDLRHYSPAGRQVHLKVTYRYNRNQIVEVETEDLQDRRKLPIKKIEDVDLNLLETGGKSIQVALLIDCSGSMAGSRMEEAKKAAIGSLKKFRAPQGFVGLIGFPGGVLHPLSYDFGSIEKQINRLSADNGTPMTMALDPHTSPCSCRQIPKMSSCSCRTGHPPVHQAPRAATDAAKAQGIGIITIGVSGADERFLKAIASSPDDYHFCNQTFELESTFVNIATQLSAGRFFKNLLNGNERISMDQKTPLPQSSQKSMRDRKPWRRKAVLGSKASPHWPKKKRAMNYCPCSVRTIKPLSK